MSMPSIPNITPEVSLTRDDTINMLLSSIAMEEMALAHIMNAEAEKLQYVLGTLRSSDREDDRTDTDSKNGMDEAHCLEDIIQVNESIIRMMKTITLKEVLLQLKLLNTLELIHVLDDKMGEETL